MTPQPTTVLIAEDETIIRLDLRRELEELGYTICGEAQTGVEAVELAHSAAPDPAVLDVKMPGLDGIEAARQTLAERSLPIVMLTAYGDEELVRRAAKVGVYSYLVKPYRSTDLMPAIETAVARHEEMSSLRDEAAALSDALAARKSLERAKGLLMEREGLSERDAFARLRRASQASGQPLKVIADAIVAAFS